MVLKEALVFARYLRAPDPDDVASLVAEIVDQQALAGTFTPTDEATLRRRIRRTVRHVVDNARRGVKRQEAGYERLARASEVKDTSGPIEMRPDKFAIARDREQAADAALRLLPEKKRRVVKLRMDDRTITEIARSCRLTERQVYNILADVYLMLAAALHAHAPETLQ